jgi:hypothetical protein
MESLRIDRPDCRLESPVLRRTAPLRVVLKMLPLFRESSFLSESANTYALPLVRTGRANGILSFSRDAQTIVCREFARQPGLTLRQPLRCTVST